MRLLGRLRCPWDEPRGCELTRYIAVAAYHGFRLDYLIDAHTDSFFSLTSSAAVTVPEEPLVEPGDPPSPDLWRYLGRISK
jgi:hypothetical protein